MRLVIFAVITAFVFAWWAVPDRPPYASNMPLPEPVVFGEGVISTGDYNMNSAFTPDGKTIYYTKSSQAMTAGRLAVIVFSQFRNGKWQMPAVASFSGQYADYDPFVTADGTKLFFVSDRPAPGRERRDFDIWYVEKTAGGWSEPKNIGPPVNTAGNPNSIPLWHGMAPCISAATGTAVKAVWTFTVRDSSMDTMLSRRI